MSAFDLPAHVLDQAIAWDVALRSGTASDAQHDACRVWREADPLHGRAWEALQAMEADLTDLTGGTQNAASLKTLAAQTLAGTQQPPRRRALRRLAGGIGLVAAVLLAAHTLWPSGEEHFTAKGQRQSLMLADGTELLLNTDTRVRVHHSDTLRRIELLRGEIALTTGSDPQAPQGHRPLEVDTPEARFRALGTRFSVRRFDAHSELRVEEGRVAMDTERASALAPTAPVARPGEAFVVGPDGVRPAPPATLEPGAWTDGVLVAKRTTLADFVAELNRHHPRRVEAASAVAQLQVSGVFQLDNPDRALDALPRSLPVRIVRTAGAGTIRIEPR
ncbi:MAG: FecR domain-containing protein [Rhizobacter sp.]